MKKEKIKYSIITVITLIIVLVVSSYAYYYISDSLDQTLDGISGTTDVLTFEAGSRINIDADIYNLGKNKGNIAKSTEVKATLIPNNATNEAHAKYNMFLVIEDNSLVYTTEAKKAELLIRITTPEGKPLEHLEGINKLSDGSFDITTRIGTFLIARDYEIDAENDITTQTWEIEVSLVNLESSQNANVNNRFSGKIYITKEDMDTYKAPEVNYMSVEPGYKSLNVSLEYNQGTSDVVKYYFGIKKSVSAVSRIRTIGSDAPEEPIEYFASEDGTYKFENLDVDADYDVYSFVEDEEGIYSNVYVAKGHTEEYRAPKITNVKINKSLGDTTGKLEITVTGEAYEDPKTIEKYYYSIDNGEYEESDSNTKVYDGLTQGREYRLRIKIKDANGHESAEYITQKTIDKRIIINFEPNNNQVSSNQENCIIDVGAGNDSCEITTPKITANTNTPTIIGYSESADSHVKIIGSEEILKVNLTMDGKTYYAQSKHDATTNKVNFNANGNAIDATSKECTISETFNGTAQGTSCPVTTPKITAPTVTPTIVGYNQTSTATISQVGSAAPLTIDSNNKGKTYYAITRNDPISQSVTFNANNNTIAATSASCSIPSSYNGKTQGNSCTLKTPKITAPAATPTVLGYSQNSAATNAEVGSEASLTVNASNKGKIYYAITRHDAVTYTVTFEPGLNTSAIGAPSGSCNITATYNGVAQAESCTIVTPTITRSSTSYDVLGWATVKESTLGVAAGSNITVSQNGLIYYANCAVSLTITVSVASGGYAASCKSSYVQGNRWRFTYSLPTGVSIMKKAGKICYAGTKDYCRSRSSGNGEASGSAGWACFVDSKNRWEFYRSGGTVKVVDMKNSLGVKKSKSKAA